MTIQTGDEISRCIIYDKAFKNNVHVNSALIILTSSDEEGVYHESGVIRRLAPLSSDVHRIGCKIAGIQNVRKGNPEPGPKRKYYCGFRTAKVDSLPLSGDGYNVVLTLDNEGGEIAHVDIAVTIADGTRSERTTHRANAGMALALEFGLPEEHICEVDQQDEHHPLRKYPGCLTADLSIDSLYLSHQENSVVEKVLKPAAILSEEASHVTPSKVV